MNRPFFLSFFFFCILFSEIASKNRPVPYEDLCEKGVAYLLEGNSDSATVCFLLAYTRGLPSDSLYYFLGQTYLIQGIYDSALALSYAIKQSGRGSFHLKVLKQRYHIYSGLGWNDLATDVLDTIKKLRPYRALSAIPALDIGMKSGYATNTYAFNATIPWNRVDEQFRNDMKGMLYNADAVLRWDFPALPQNKISTGAGLHVDKPYWTGHALDDFDSVSVAGNAFFGLTDLFGHLAVMYDAKYKRYYNTSSMLSQFMSLSCNWHSRSTLWFLTGAYSLDLDNEYAVDGHTFYVLSYHGFFLQKKSGLNLLLSVTGYVDDMFRMDFFSHPTYVYYVSMDGPDVEYYTDGTFSEKLDTADILWTEVAGRLLNTRDTLEVFRTLPQTNFRYAISLEYTRLFRPTLTGHIGMQWHCTHYPEAYRWTSLDKATADSLDSYGKALAMNAADRVLYYFNETPRVSGLGSKNISESISTQTASITQHNAKRIDNTITLTATVEKKFKRMGSLEMVVTGYKTWSTLGNDAPVDIPLTGGSITLQWKKGVTFTRG